jgi:hypothetical protein
VCATETKLDVDIEAYASALADLMHASRNVHGTAQAFEENA